MISLSDILDQKIATLEKHLQPTLFSLSTPMGDKQFALVPKGLGGEKVGDTTLVSLDSPLGQKLNRPKVGEKISLNDNIFTVLSRASLSQYSSVI